MSLSKCTVCGNTDTVGHRQNMKTKEKEYFCEHHWIEMIESEAKRQAAIAGLKAQKDKIK